MNTPPPHEANRMNQDDYNNRACKTLPKHIFFPTYPRGKPSPEHTRQFRDAVDLAKSVCQRCPWVDQCLQETLDNEYAVWKSTGQTDPSEVVAGGMTRRERDEERDRRARGQLSLLVTHETPVHVPTPPKTTRHYSERIKPTVAEQIDTLFPTLKAAV